MKPQPSLRRRLLTSLMLTILITWLVVLLLVFASARHEVEEVFDADLARSAHVLQALLLHEVEEEQLVDKQAKLVMAEVGSDELSHYPALAAILAGYLDRSGLEQLEFKDLAEEYTHKYESKLTFVARYSDGTVMLRSNGAPDVAPGSKGYLDIIENGTKWRVFSLHDPVTGLNVQVGESAEIRRDLVRYITRGTLTPLIVAFPILALLIWLAVGRGMRPLHRVATEVARRAPDSLEPISDHGAPREIRSLLLALNQLFQRVGDVIQRERQFTADAAHELRTPLAALKTHLQVARNGSRDTATRQSLDHALTGVDRATHSVEQLLALARADAGQRRMLVHARVDLREIAMGVVSALSQEALDQEIDLGLDAAASLYVNGDLTSLQILLRNLVDNAIRYTQRGGTVTVAVELLEDHPTLEVADNGPGITVTERQKVFTRFHRGPEEQARGTTGSGLGLSLVQRIAELHGAELNLGKGIDGAGLGIAVRFPAVFAS